MKWCDWMPWSLPFECWVLSQLFYSPLSPSSRSSLDPLYFLPSGWYHLHIYGCWYFFWQSWFWLVIHSCHLLLDHVQFTLIHAPNIPDSYAVLFLTASDFAFTTRLSFHFHCHNWAWFCYTSTFAMTRLWSMKGSLKVITDWIRASQLCL